jgi:hypothetical protein
MLESNSPTRSFVFHFSPNCCLDSFWQETKVINTNLSLAKAVFTRETESKTNSRSPKPAGLL